MGSIFCSEPLFLFRKLFTWAISVKVSSAPWLKHRVRKTLSEYRSSEANMNLNKVGDRTIC